MAYKREICRAGKTRQYTYYYCPKADKKEGSRRAKENRTSEAQKKVNSRQAAKKLTWIMNANYDGSSLYITYSYSKENRPEGKETLRKDVDCLLRGLRKAFKKKGQTAKYIWVAEIGKKGAAHLHMTLNAIEPQILKSLWTKGWVTIKPMDDSGQYRKLANYFIKYSEKTMNTLEGFSGRRYNSSKNLVIPEPKKEIVSARNAISHTIVVPPGWYVDKDSIAEAYHEITGFMYFTYTLIHDGRQQKETKRDSYQLDLETGEVTIQETRQKTRRERIK